MGRLALPRDIGEQNSILEFIDRETAAFNNGIEKTQREITLIREYRERLIADVVTGKLDVRHIEISASAEDTTTEDAEDLEEDGDRDVADVPEDHDAE